MLVSRVVGVGADAPAEFVTTRVGLGELLVNAHVPAAEQQPHATTVPANANSTPDTGNTARAPAGAAPEGR